MDYIYIHDEQSTVMEIVLWKNSILLNYMVRHRIEILIKVFIGGNEIEKSTPFLETDMPFNQAWEVILMISRESSIF